MTHLRAIIESFLKNSGTLQRKASFVQRGARSNYPAHVQWFASTTGASPNPSSGEEAYRLYQDALLKLTQIETEQETEKSKRLFEAWSQSSSRGDANAMQETKGQNRTSNKSAGVAVIRTLAKQSKMEILPEEKRTHVQTIQGELKGRATMLLNVAAQQYRHPVALVTLANEMLQENRHVDLGALETVSISHNTVIERALDYYRQAGEQGSAEGWFNLGHVLWTGAKVGSDVLHPNPRDALRSFHKAIELYDNDAMYFVGVLILGQNDGENQTSEIDFAAAIEYSLHDAVRWIEQAAASGHGGALYYLAVFHLNGYAPLKISPCSSEEFLQRLDAAIRCDETGEAHFLRGSCHYSGSSWHEHDVARALSDFLTASELGHADAAVNAGAILHRGNTQFRIQVDHHKAFQLYQRAGELGSLEGWRNVVACYATGHGVKQSQETARYIAETMLRHNDEQDS